MKNIEWTDKMWNPVTGCTESSEGCESSYAERVTHHTIAIRRIASTILKLYWTVRDRLISRTNQSRV